MVNQYLTLLRKFVGLTNFSCNAQLSSSRWHTWINFLVGSPLTTARWVSSEGGGGGGWVGAYSCYLEMLDKLQKQITRTVVPSFGASLETSAHCQNKTNLGITVIGVHLNWFCAFFLVTSCLLLPVQTCME